MKRRAVFLTSLFAAIAATFATWLLLFRSVPRSDGPLRHEVYVWQRAWTQPVRDAVSQHATNFAEIVPLKAEISWKDGKPQLSMGVSCNTQDVDFGYIPKKESSGSDDEDM